MSLATGNPAARDVTQARALSMSGGPARVAGSPFVHAGVTGTSRERIPTVIIDEHGAMARVVAERIAALIRSRQAEGRTIVLGLATGSTPIGVYRELIRLHRDEGLSFRNVISFNLDEYYPMQPDSIHSYHRFMWENLFSHVDIDPANVNIPAGSLDRAASGQRANPSVGGARAQSGRRPLHVQSGALREYVRRLHPYRIV